MSKVDWIQTARLNADEMDKDRMAHMPGEAGLLRGLANEIERLYNGIEGVAEELDTVGLDAHAAELYDEAKAYMKARELLLAVLPLSKRSN